MTEDIQPRYPYPQYFQSRHDAGRRARNQEILMTKPIKSRYSEAFSIALADADAYTLKQSIDDLEKEPDRHKTRIKVLTKRWKALSEENKESIALDYKTFHGVIWQDQRYGLNVVIISILSSSWIAHIIDSEDVWAALDYFHERIDRHHAATESGNSDCLVNGRDALLRVRLHQNDEPPRTLMMPDEGDQVKLHKDFLPQTLQWSPGTGVKGVRGEWIVCTSAIGDGVYLGKEGLIVEVDDRQETFTVTLEGPITGHSGDSVTLPMNRDQLARRFHPRELTNESLFDVKDTGPIGIYLSYEGSDEFKISAHSIRKIIRLGDVNGLD